MGIDVLALIDAKGGDLAAVRASQAKRFAPPEVVDDVLNMYNEWVKRTYSSYPRPGPLELIRGVFADDSELRVDATAEAGQHPPEGDWDEDEGQEEPSVACRELELMGI